MANYEYSNDDGLTFDDAFDFEASAREYMGWRADQAQTDSGELIGTYNSGTDSMQADQITLPDGTTFGAEDTGSRWINQEIQSPTTAAPTQTLKDAIASGTLPQSKAGQMLTGKGDETATNLINSITKALGHQGIAVLRRRELGGLCSSGFTFGGGLFSCQFLLASTLGFFLRQGGFRLLQALLDVTAAFSTGRGYCCNLRFAHRFGGHNGSGLGGRFAGAALAGRQALFVLAFQSGCHGHIRLGLGQRLAGGVGVLRGQLLLALLQVGAGQLALVLLDTHVILLGALLQGGQALLGGLQLATADLRGDAIEARDQLIGGPVFGMGLA